MLSVSHMAAPRRETFESERNTLKDTSSLSNVNQNIQNQQKSLQQQNAASESTVKETMRTQDQSLNNEKGKMQQEYKEGDDKGLSGKAWDAFWDTDEFNKKS